MRFEAAAQQASMHDARLVRARKDRGDGMTWGRGIFDPEFLLHESQVLHNGIGPTFSPGALTNSSESLYITVVHREPFSLSN